MTRRMMAAAGVLCLLFFISGCDDGVDDWSSSARVTGEVYTDASHTRGVEGVRVILESDQQSDTPYKGPDRWTVTDSRGHFEGAVFLGHSSDGYNYLGDLSVAYFWNGKVLNWSGGITVGPGSVFTLPPVDTTMFSIPTNGGQ